MSVLDLRQRPQIPLRCLPPGSTASALPETTFKGSALGTRRSQEVEHRVDLADRPSV